MILYSLLIVIVLAGAAVYAFLHSPSFGRLPRGTRLERILNSPHYRDGAFRNEPEVPLMTSGKSRISGMIDFLFRKPEGLRPETVLPVIKTNLKELSPGEDILIWFGHSSYYIQMEGKRLLVDPVFYDASPVAFVNRAFKGTDIYRPEDMPDIDFLIITHDHWDHLDYRTVTELRERTGKVICALGVGEHLEYWGVDKNRIVELDWNEDASLGDGFTVHCLPPDISRVAD